MRLNLGILKKDMWHRVKGIIKNPVTDTKIDKVGFIDNRPSTY